MGKIIANSVDVSSAPEEIKILPLGHVDSQKGDFYVDDESFALIQQRFKDRQLDLVIDYEHQTLKDMQAPAAGWIKELIHGPDAIIAKVEWTKQGAEYLKNKEYKYLSPVVITRKQDKKVVALHSAALTNTPAIDGMFAIVNSEKGETEDTFQAFLSSIKSMLQLPETSDYESVLSVIKELLNSKELMETENAALKEDIHERTIQDTVAYALKKGKISAAMKEQAELFARNDLTAFKDFVEIAPEHVPMTSFFSKEALTLNTQPKKSKIEELLGITDEDIKKYND